MGSGAARSGPSGRGMRRSRGASAHRRGSWGRLLLVPLVGLVEPGRDEGGEGGEGGLGVGPAGLQVEPGAALGGERGQVEDALAVELLTVVDDADLGLILVGEADELVG